MFYEEPKKVIRSGKGVFTCENDGFCSMEIYAWEYPEVTYENSPVRVEVKPVLPAITEKPENRMSFGRKLFNSAGISLLAILGLYLLAQALQIKVIAVTIGVIFALVIIVGLVYQTIYGDCDEF
jgi:hypothetical protein